MPSAAGAYGAVGRVIRVAADVSHFRIKQTLAVEGFAEEVLDAPETAGGDGTFLGTFWEGDGGASGGI